MDEESRTAIFDRKRPIDEASLDESKDSGSTKSTPRKRAKRVERESHQDVRDFVPNGGSFSTIEFPLNQEQDLKVSSSPNLSRYSSDNVHSQEDYSPNQGAQNSSVEAAVGAEKVVSTRELSSTVDADVPVAGNQSEIPIFRDVYTGATIGHKIKLPVRENRAYSRCK